MNYPELDALFNSKEKTNEVYMFRRAIAAQLYEVEFPMIPADDEAQPIVKKLEFTDLFDGETSNIVKAQKYYDAEMKNTPKSFGAALKYHMEQRAMSGSELADITGIAPSTISKMVNEDITEEVHRSIKNLVAICIALKLPPKMSYNLIDLAGCKLMNNAQERAYCFALDFLYTFPLSLCDGFLMQLGAEPIITENKTKKLKK